MGRLIRKRPISKKRARLFAGENMLDFLTWWRRDNIIHRNLKERRRERHFAIIGRNQYRFAISNCINPDDIFACGKRLFLNHGGAPNPARFFPVPDCNHKVGLVNRDKASL